MVNETQLVPDTAEASAAAESGKEKTVNNNPLAGATYFLKGLTLINKRGIRPFVAVPLLVNTLLFGLLIVYGASELGKLIERLVGWLPDWLDWLTWLLWPVFGLTAVLVVFFTFSLLANIIAAPFNGILAEAVEKRITGQAPPSDPWSRILKTLLSSVASELRKLLYFLVRAVPLLILFLIPGLNVAAPFLWMLFTAWMLALEYGDYPMGNHGVLFPEQRKLMARRRLLGLGFGGAVMLALMVPGLNFVVIPTAVAGATAMWVERFPKRADTTTGRR